MCRGFFVAFLLMIPTLGLSQFIVIDDCGATADPKGMFSTSCQIKNLSAQAHISVLTFGEDNVDSVGITLNKQILGRNEVARMEVRGKLTTATIVGSVKVEIRWLDYEGKPMLTEYLITIVPSSD